MLIGPSQCGKTSLTQCMRGEALHYQKTQTIVWSPTAIDTPDGYFENRCLYSVLLINACEADIIALVLSTDTPWSPFSPSFTGPMNRPVIGLTTKAGLVDPQRVSLAEGWLAQADAQKVFATSALENIRIDEMFVSLNAEEPSCPTK